MGGADLRPSSTPGRNAGGEVKEVKAYERTAQGSRPAQHLIFSCDLPGLG